MKAFFRFLRGELNGYYLTRLNNVNNSIAESVKEFLAYFKKMQFKTSDELSEGEVAISPEMAKGIGITAGVFPSYILQDSLPTAIRFTNSHKVNGVEYSERGLYSPDEEAFNFVRTTEDEYEDDINTLSGSHARSSLVEEGRRPVGYFPEEEKVITNEGEIDYSKLLTSPRSGHADSPFYGDNFLYLSESYPVLAETDSDTMLKVIEAMQWVRYNGVNIASLIQFAETLCKGFLYILDIKWTTVYAHGIVEFGIDTEATADKKLLRENIFRFLIEKKFPQLTFQEVTIRVTRDSKGRVKTVKKIK